MSELPVDDPILRAERRAERITLMALAITVVNVVITAWNAGHIYGSW